MYKRQPPKRRGCSYVIANKDFKESSHVPAEKMARPDEQSLRRLTKDELMPPPSFVPDGILVESPIVEGLVRSQDIIFLVIQKAAGDANAPWSFPSEETLDELCDFIIGDLVSKDEPRVCDTFLDRRIDPEKGIATITLCTEDMRLFDMIRNDIRYYTGSAGSVSYTHLTLPTIYSV